MLVLALGINDRSIEIYNPPKEPKTEKLEKTCKELEKEFELTKKAFQLKKEKMLSEKVDVTKFIIWLIENYPASITKLKADPKYQGTFM